MASEENVSAGSSFLPASPLGPDDSVGDGSGAFMLLSVASYLTDHSN